MNEWSDDQFLSWLEKRGIEFRPRAAAEEPLWSKDWAGDLAVVSERDLRWEFEIMLSVLASCPKACARVSRLLHERGEQLDARLRRKLRLHGDGALFDYEVSWRRLLEFLTPPQRKELEQLKEEVTRTWPRHAHTAHIMCGGLMLCNPITHQPVCIWEKRRFSLTFYQGLPAGVEVKIITRPDFLGCLYRGLGLRVSTATAAASPTAAPPVTSAASSSTKTPASAANEQQGAAAPPHAPQQASTCGGASSFAIRAEAWTSVWNPLWLRGGAGPAWQLQQQAMGVEFGSAESELITPLLMFTDQEV